MSKILCSVFLLMAFSAVARGQVQLQSEARTHAQIVAESVESQPLVCVADSSLKALAGTCRINGTVNSGSGIGVAVSMTISGGTVSRVEVTRAGITFSYDRAITTHSEISGPCFSAHYTVKAFFTDGSTCTVTTTGNPPHSACTDAALANAAAAAHAASYTDILAPGAIVAIFGRGMASQIQAAPSLPLPEQMAGVEVRLFYNTPLERKARLFYVSPDQVNVLLPDGLPSGGIGTLAVVNAFTETLKPTWFYLNPAQPGVFTASANGQGPAKAYYDQGHLVLYASGLNRAVRSTVYLQIGNRQLPASFADLIEGFAGLYQINVPDGASVRGSYGALCAAGRCSQIFQVPP